MRFQCMRGYTGVVAPHFVQQRIARHHTIRGTVKELEDVGDLLPTFFHTHKEYKKFLETELIVCQTDIKYLRQISSSRRSRRSRGIPYDFSKEIPTFEEFQEQQNLLKETTK